MVKKNNLTLSFIPFSDISHLSGSERIKKIIDIVIKNKIVILQGRLKPEEEISLIQSTMAIVGHVKKFKGVELAVIEPNKKGKSMFGKMKSGLLKALGGSNELTIIGPASIVKQVKRDPSKIELLLKK